MEMYPEREEKFNDGPSGHLKSLREKRRHERQRTHAA
jgi:hypothetical protein